MKIFNKCEYWIIIIIISADWRSLLDIGLPQMSPHRPVPCFSHPAGSRDFHKVIGPPCRESTHAYWILGDKMKKTKNNSSRIQKTKKKRNRTKNLKQHLLWQIRHKPSTKRSRFAPSNWRKRARECFIIVCRGPMSQRSGQNTMWAVMHFCGLRGVLGVLLVLYLWCSLRFNGPLFSWNRRGLYQIFAHKMNYVDLWEL